MKALDACAAYITGALSHHLAETGFNGLSWQQLITQAAEHGLKPKTMRLARCYLRDKAKTLLLYRTKVVGCRETKYLWGLVGHALPEFSEVISHDPEDEVCTLIAAVKAGARTLNPEGIRADGPLPADPSCNDGSSMFRRLSDGVSGSTLAYPPSLSPHHSDAPSAGEPTASGDSRDALCNSQSSRRRFVPYHELEKQFGVGVAKAASNLGICKTTLKRICRQHGIKQWPRRQIAKALSQLAAGDNGSSGTGGANSSHQLQVTATPRSMPSAPAQASLPLNQSSNALVVDTPSWAAGPHQPSARLALPAPPPQSSPLPSPYRSSNAFPSSTITKHMQLYGSSTQSHYEPCATQGMGGSAGFRMRPMDAPSARPAGMLGMSSMQQTAAAPSASTSASHAAASLRFLGAAGNASARPSAPRAFTDSMHWQSSCSAAPNPRQVPQSVSLASHGRPMSSAAPMSGSVSGLPWVHLPQFGVSCPVYVMLPDQRL